MATRVYFTYFIAVDFGPMIQPVIKFGPYESKEKTINLAKALNEVEQYNYVVVERKWTYRDEPLESQKYNPDDNRDTIIRV